MLNVLDLHANVDDKEILKGVDLSVHQGEIHALMGQNGSGKSTLAQVLMGSPIFTPTKGSADFLEQNLLEMDPSERAHLGIFLSFQQPFEIQGVNVSNYLRMIYQNKTEKKISPIKFKNHIKDLLTLLGVDEAFLTRSLNEGFSGGEKKRMEMLQMLILEPKLAILDEVDSGLDIDSLKIVSEAVNYLHKKTNMAVLIITHYTRILNYIKPTHVHIMRNGKLVRNGDASLAHELESKGYAHIFS